MYNLVGIEFGGITVFHFSVSMSSFQKKISNSIYVAISPVFVYILLDVSSLY